MERFGYGPGHPLKVKLSVRNIAIGRDAAVILIDQLKTIGIDGELDPIDTAIWYSKVTRKDYAVGLNLTAGGVDDPDQQFYEHYPCGSGRNNTGDRNPQLEKPFERQSIQAAQEKRTKLAWEIDTGLQAGVIGRGVDGNEARSACVGSSGSAVTCVHGTGGIRAKAGRHFENAPFRQPGEHVAARRIDGRGHPADDARLQQSGDVQAGCAAKQPALDPPRPRHQLGIEPQRDRTVHPPAATYPL